jgi:hypothetical protein
MQSKLQLINRLLGYKLLDKGFILELLNEDSPLPKQNSLTPISQLRLIEFRTLMQCSDDESLTHYLFEQFNNSPQKRPHAETRDDAPEAKRKLPKPGNSNQNPSIAQPFNLHPDTCPESLKTQMPDLITLMQAIVTMNPVQDDIHHEHSYIELIGKLFAKTSTLTQGTYYSELQKVVAQVLLDILDKDGVDLSRVLSMIPEHIKPDKPTITLWDSEKQLRFILINTLIQLHDHDNG